MTAYAQPGSSIWAKALRITPLDPLGNLIAGVSTLVTDTMVKLTITPVMEAGDQVAIKNAAGDLSTWAKHGDIIKWYTLLLELAIPDPQLEAALAGGVVFSDNGTALGLVSGLAATPYNSGGTLAAGTYGYKVTQYNTYGQSVGSAEVTATVTGTGQVYLTTSALAVGALGVNFFGRTIGGEQLLGSLRNIGSQTTSATIAAGTPTTVPVTALTQPIPAGYTFTIAGDTNATKILFTTTAAAGIGAVVLPVTVSAAVVTAITAAAIVPTFVDNGVVVPNGIAPTVDGTAGPGVGVGYQAPATGSVANSSGVAIEAWGERFIGGVQASDRPYWRHLYPMAKNFHQMPRDITNANFVSIFEGDAFPNPNFGTGPDGTWNFDSSKIYQRKQESGLIMPTPSVAPQSALY